MVIFADSFFGADGNAWDAGKWIPSSRGTGSTAIQGNRGRLSIGTGFPNEAQAIAINSTHADAEVHLSYQFTSLGGIVPTAGAELQIWLRASGNWNAGGGGDEQWPTNGYTVYPSNFDQAVGVGKNRAVVKVVAGVASLVGYVPPSPGGEPAVDTNKYWLRFRVAANHIYVKKWADGVPEPVPWDVDLVDNSLAAGVLQIALIAESTNPSPTSCDIDDLVLDNG
jgi:hypothetical protein